ncbi:10730_t:CDS:2, partial [Funneliformis geosporum]
HFSTLAIVYVLAPCVRFSKSELSVLRSANFEENNNQGLIIKNSSFTRSRKKFYLFNITDGDISMYPWDIENTSMHERIKTCLRDVNLDNLDYDEPICSSIIDTEFPPIYIRKEVSNNEWEIISDNKHCYYKQFFRKNERFFTTSEDIAITQHLPEKPSRASSERRNSVSSDTYNSSDENKENKESVTKKRKRKNEKLPSIEK